MVYVRLAQDWTDSAGTPHAAGEMVDVDAATLATLEASGVVTESDPPSGGDGTDGGWPSPTGGTGGGSTDGGWPSPTGGTGGGSTDGGWPSPTSDPAGG